MSVNSLPPRSSRSFTVPSFAWLWIAIVLCTALVWRLTSGSTTTTTTTPSTTDTTAAEYRHSSLTAAKSQNEVVQRFISDGATREETAAPLQARWQPDSNAIHLERNSAPRAAAARQSSYRAQFLSSFASRHPPMARIGKQEGDPRLVLFNASLARSGDYGWRFVRYEPSEFEVAFTDRLATLGSEVAAGQLTDSPGRTLQDVWQRLAAPFQERIEALLREMPLHATRKDNSSLAARYCDPKGHAHSGSRSGEQRAHPLLSRMIYEFACLVPPCRLLTDSDSSSVPHRVGDTYSAFIEPLVGPLQHPALFLELAKGATAVPSASDHVRESYLLSDRWALHNLGVRWQLRRASETRQRPAAGLQSQNTVSHVFDIGAGSSFRHGSSSWLVNLASALCVPPTEIRCWEAASVRPSIYWKTVPERLHPKVYWNNFPPSTNPLSWNNPLNHLISETILGEPVLLKIRMNSLDAESMLIEQLRTIPDAYLRVDELFLAFSFSFFPSEKVPRADGKPRWLFPVFGATPSAATPTARKGGAPLCNVSCIIRTVQLFRNIGVRAHVWS